MYRTFFTIPRLKKLTKYTLRIRSKRDLLHLNRFKQRRYLCLRSLRGLLLRLTPGFLSFFAFLLWGTASGDLALKTGNLLLGFGTFFLVGGVRSCL